VNKGIKVLIMCSVCWTIASPYLHAEEEVGLIQRLWRKIFGQPRAQQPTNMIHSKVMSVNTTHNGEDDEDQAGMTPEETEEREQRRVLEREREQRKLLRDVRGAQEAQRELPRR